MNRSYRLPLPATEWITAAAALRKARLRRLAVIGDSPTTRRLAGITEAAGIEQVAALDDFEGDLPADADSVLWAPDAEVLAEFLEPAHLEDLRHRLGTRRLAWVVPPATDQAAVRALSEAGFALQRHDPVRFEPQPDRDRTAPGGEVQDAVCLVVQADAFRIRTCREDDVDAILELFAPLFSVRRSRRHWCWKYLDNPWGRLWVSLVETADQELVAHYAGFPVPLVRFADGVRRDLLVEHVGDTMTVPAYRQVGVGWTSLLGRALRRHFAVFGHGRVAFYYGINTGKIRQFNLRVVGSRWAGSAGYRRRAAVPSGAKLRFGERAERLDPFDARFPTAHAAAGFDAFFDHVCHHYRVLVRKDSEWLHWRYATCPDEPRFFALTLRSWGRLVGWSVFRRHHDPATGRAQLRWVDALFDPRHAAGAAALLDLALAQPEAAGVHEVTAWFSPRPAWWLEVLERLCFERRAEPDDLGFIYLPFDDPEVDDYIFDLYYTWGDTDLT